MEAGELVIGLEAPEERVEQQMAAVVGVPLECQAQMMEVGEA